MTVMSAYILTEASTPATAVCNTARSRNSTIAMIDTCHDARSVFEKSMMISAYDQLISMGKPSHRPRLDLYLEALSNEEAAKDFLVLYNNATSAGGDGTTALTKRLVSIFIRDSAPPSSIDHLCQQQDSAFVRQSSALREAVMCERIQSLCRGDITGGKPRTRIIAVVGQDHVHPLRAMLSGMAGVVDVS